MKINKKIFIMSISLFFMLNANAQRIPITTSSCTSGSRFAHFSVKLFLTLPDRQNSRIETGAINETVDQIAVLEDEEACNSLQNFISSNQKFDDINQSIIGTDKQMYFYKTDNFYYVFWAKKPEFDDRYGTGPKSLFIVIKNDLSQFWEYYF
ncbi:MAG: hypothetical protein AAF620_17070 [Bacteroidota bacterium]